MEKPLIFISYSHKDESEKEELITHLGALRFQGKLEIWSDDQIIAGENWIDKIDGILSSADLAIFLVTANFLNSAFILHKEVPKMLERQRDEGVIIFPLIAKFCAWKSVDWLNKMQLRPKNGSPIWREQGIHKDKELTDIVNEIAKLIIRKQNQVSDDSTSHRKKGEFIPTARCRRIIGRDGLIDGLIGKLNDTGELSIFSLNGGPGYGKTEIARSVSEMVLNQKSFEDVLWVTARKTEFNYGLTKKIDENKNFLSKQSFLEELATQIDYPVQQSEKKIKNSKYLIVFDNAEDSNIEEIIPFLADVTRHSRAIITTRMQVQTPYVGSINVNGLEEEWSKKLLIDEAGYIGIPEILNASKNDLKAIYQQTLGVPLALHFVVSRVYHDHSIKPVIDDLYQANSIVSTFYTYCFKSAWLRLSDTAKNILRYMGHFSERRISKEDLCKPWSIELPIFYQAISELEKWYLIDIDTNTFAEPLYDLHPWIRSSIRSNLLDTWKPSEDDIKRFVTWQIGHLSQG
jgi:hypothetical protein